MHLTSAIAERKQDLFRYHAIRTFYDVLTIILLEGVLSIVSIPLYFSMRTETLSPENAFNVEYSIRKTLTFTVFFLLFCILFVKAFIISGLVASQSAQPPIAGSVPMPYEQIYDALVAPVDQTMPKPVIGDVSVSKERGFSVRGTAKPGTVVIVTVTNKDGDVFSPTTQMYNVQTASDGGWNLFSSKLFNLKAGSYVFQAQSFDEGLQKKSSPSSSVDYIFQATPDEILLNHLDNAANILLFSFIAIGLLVVFLTF